MIEEPDRILLDRINQLELTLAERDRQIDKMLSAPSLLTKHIGEPIAKAWSWWWDSEDRLGGTLVSLFFSIVIYAIIWLVLGWPTNQFYIDYSSGHGQPMGVYQTYSFGKDVRVLRCNNTDIADCVSKMKVHKIEWDKYQATLKN